MPLVLASTSPSRLRLLRMAGIEPIVVPPEVDEEALVAEREPASPVEHVQLLATAKARAVAGMPPPVAERAALPPVAERAALPPVAERAALPPVAERAEGETKRTVTSTLILGCDSAFELDGVVYGKPHHAAVAAARWRRMRGRTGVLHTGHCLIDAATSEPREAVVSTAVTFAEVSDDEIDWYVATGEPLPVAGAFTLEGLAAPFVTEVAGDPHSVVGLSLAALRGLALELGHPWTELVGGAQRG